MSAEARQRALSQIICRLLHAPNRRHTVVLLVEDLHWIDEASDEMLGGLIEEIAGTNTLVLVNYRPEYRPDWADSSSYAEMRLKPLTEEDTRELLGDIAGSDPSLDGLENLIHDRTQGNPFFIEEIMRDLAECGYLEGERGSYRLAKPVEDAGVPATVQAILAARIDRLSPDAKRLLQVASVVGKELGEQALALTSGLEPEEMEPALRELTASGFLYEAEIYPERILAFRHPLTQEVAYGTQLADRRAATHAAAARALIELEPERLDELAVLVARHMEEGGETLEAARWSARAAYWTGSSQPAEAMRLWGEVTRLADQLEAEGAETGGEAAALATTSRLLQLDFAWRVGIGKDEERQLIAEAEELAQGCGDLRSLALLSMTKGARPGLSQSTDEWMAAADEAAELADASGDDHLRVAIHSAGAYARLCAGRFDEFDRRLDHVLAIAGGDPSVGAGVIIGNPMAWALQGKAIVRKERGELEEARRLVDKAFEVSSAAHDLETESWIRGMQAMVRAASGDLEGAVALNRRNCELTERLGDAFSRSLARSNLGWAELAAGEYEAALGSIEEAERLYRSAMDTGGEMEAWRGALHTEALRGVGRLDEAIEAGERAVEVARQRRLLWSLPLALHALGRTLAEAGDGERARAAFDEAAELAEGTGATAALEEIQADREALVAEAGRA
jgi:adenylate cyclase